MSQKLNINCPIGGTGYGITSANIVKKLYENNDIDLSLFPIGNSISVNDDEEKEIFYKLINNNVSFNKKAPCLKIWHQHDLALRIGVGDYYSFPFFELDTLNIKEINSLNSCDYIFTASNWSKQVLKNNGINSPVYISPLGVDRKIFQTPNKIRRDSGSYVFAHVGKWEKRKSQDFLLDCFSKAFDINDNVELWLVPYNMFLNEEEESYWIKLVDNNKLNNKIKIFNRLPTQYHLAEFIYYSDCGVFLSRAEGWNNEILEFMALNKPIIATNYSAHTEYCNDSNCFLVEIDELESANDGKWFNGQGKWAKLSDSQTEQTVNYMRHVYSNNITHNEEGLKTSNIYSWDNTAKIIHNTMMENNSYHANS